MKFNKIFLTLLACLTVGSFVVAKKITIINNTDRTITNLRIKAKADGDKILVYRQYEGPQDEGSQDLVAGATVTVVIPDNAVIKKIRVDLQAIHENEIERIGQDKIGQTREQIEAARRVRADLQAVDTNEIERIGQTIEQKEAAKRVREATRRGKLVPTAREKNPENLNGTSFSIVERAHDEIGENRHLFKVEKMN